MCRWQCRSRGGSSRAVLLVLLLVGLLVGLLLLLMLQQLH
jgi:hypothetical protein